MTHPNFLVIGEQKCGTGWLRDRLQEHPDVFIAPKEVNFFSSKKRYAAGRRWYDEIFSAAHEPCVGEKSPEYFWQNSGREDYNHDIFALIDRTLPEAKIILALRSPVDRAFSALLHHVRHRGRRIHPKFVKEQRASDVLLSSGNDFSRYGILERGIYAERLAAAQEVFGDRLQVLIFEDDIVQDPENGLAKVCDHIGAKPFKGFEFRSNAKALKPSYSSMLLAYHLPVARPVLRRLNLGKPFRLNVTEACRERLWEYYGEDVKKVETLLGKGPLFGRLS